LLTWAFPEEVSLVPTASDLAGCGEGLPLLGVTREFDFGQFIELFDSSPDAKHPNVPIVSRVVIQPSATLAADRATATSSQALISTPSPTNSSNGSYGDAPQATSEAEVNLFTLVDEGPGAKLPAEPLSISNTAQFFESGLVTDDGLKYKLDVDDTVRDALSKGYDVTAFAEVTEGDEVLGKVPVTLSLPVHHVELASEDLARILSGGEVAADGRQVKPYLDGEAVRALVEGTSVLTSGTDAEGVSVPVQLEPSGSADRPLETRFEIFDLPAFLASPALIGKRGTSLPLEIDPEQVRQLVDVGHAELIWEGESIGLDLVRDERRPDLVEYEGLKPNGHIAGSEVGLPPTVKPPGMSWDELFQIAHGKGLNRYFTNPELEEGDVQIIHPPDGKGPGLGTGTGTTPTMTDKVQPRLPSGAGLPVAVFVPWKQTWTLKGFSRGNLLQSLALAPSEEVTLQVYSWERRARTLEQSSETEVDQATEISNSTRDTEDVFREMISKRDFAWQLSGSLDASYSNGVASISVGVDGSVSDTTSIQQTARNSSQQVKESTTKASARVRSRRITRIVQTVETGREERVTRVIRNPNQCSTLTLDFFEALAH
jgi:hypothetical protein